MLFESGNVAALTEMLVRAQSMGAAALDGMGRVGREWMRTDFTPEAYRDRMMALYRSLGSVP